MAEALKGGRKYRLALDGDRFASVSFLGTESWEDYASLAIAAMSLETLTDLAEKVDELEARLGGIESVLVEIRDALRTADGKVGQDEPASS